MRRDAIGVQLAKISMAKAQTIERKRKLTLKLKAVDEATREVKRLKSIYKATKLALELYCQGPPTDDSSAAATAMNTERTRTSRNNTLLKYGVKKK